MGVRKAFGADEDEYIRQNINRLSLGQIAQVLGRARSSVQYRIKALGLERVVVSRPSREPSECDEYETPEAEAVGGDQSGRLRRLYVVRDIMEKDILNDMVPIMQKSGYLREYRALLAEISELEGAGDAKPEGQPKNSLADALAGLAEQQRKLLERAAEP